MLWELKGFRRHRVLREHSLIHCAHQMRTLTQEMAHHQRAIDDAVEEEKQCIRDFGRRAAELSRGSVVTALGCGIAALSADLAAEFFSGLRHIVAEYTYPRMLCSTGGYVYVQRLNLGSRARSDCGVR